MANIKIQSVSRKHCLASILTIKSRGFETCEGCYERGRMEFICIHIGVSARPERNWTRNTNTWYTHIPFARSKCASIFLARNDAMEFNVLEKVFWVEIFVRLHGMNFDAIHPCSIDFDELSANSQIQWIDMTTAVSSCTDSRSEAISRKVKQESWIFAAKFFVCLHKSDCTRTQNVRFNKFFRWKMSIFVR